MGKGWTDGVPPLRGNLTTLREVAASDVYTLFTLFSNPAVTENAVTPATPASSSVRRVNEDMP